MLYLFSKTLKIRIYESKFSNCSNFNILLWFWSNLINDDDCVLAETVDTCSMVHLVCLFMKTHLLALWQDNCLELGRCAFFSKLSGCVRIITAFCQHLLRLILIYRLNPSIGQAHISVYLYLTILLKGAKPRPTILLESCTKKKLPQINWHMFYCTNKSVTQNIRGVTEGLLRATQRMLGSCMRLSNSVWESLFNK